MHYSSAVAQFIATLIMTVIRVWIRRHYTPSPIVKSLPASGGSADTSKLDPSDDKNTFGILELELGHGLDEISKRLSCCNELTICPGHLIGKDGFREVPMSGSVAQKVLQNRQK